MKAPRTLESQARAALLWCSAPGLCPQGQGSAPGAARTAPAPHAQGATFLKVPSTLSLFARPRSPQLKTLRAPQLKASLCLNWQGRSYTWAFHSLPRALASLPSLARC